MGLDVGQVFWWGLKLYWTKSLVLREMVEKNMGRGGGSKLLGGPM